MEITVTGFQQVSYTNKDGRQVNGLRLYGLYEDERVSGFATLDAFISGSNITPPVLNSRVQLTYNRWGRCSGYVPIDAG